MKNMKKLLITILASLTLLSAVGCSHTKQDAQNISSQQTISAESSETVTAEEKDHQSEVEELLKGMDFKGVVYAEKNGKTAVVFADNTLENGGAVTSDTVVPIGSVSKQFCAAAILLLQEQGKLSLDDTLDKYYPEYTAAASVTLQQLLSMRSGIPDISEEILNTVVSADNTEEQNNAKLREYFFSRPLIFEPGSAYTYSNTNFMLLGNIAEKVSGMKYIDFLRENIFTPLGMTHTGSIDEMTAGAAWAQGVVYRNIDLQPGVTKGAGDLLSNGKDIALFLNELSSGKIISAESFEAMTTDYNDGEGYGYGIRCDFFGGIGHPGSIGKFVSADVIDTEENIVVFLNSDHINAGQLNAVLSGVLNCLRES